MMKGNVIYIKYRSSKKASDVILPCYIKPKVKPPTQPDDEDKNQAPREPEHNLLASVLHRALLDLLLPDAQLAAAANNWINGDEEEENGFSFVFCCTALDLDPEMMRKKVKGLRRYLADPEGPSSSFDIAAFFLRLKNHSRRST